jgi:hypothetical protein
VSGTVLQTIENVSYQPIVRGSVESILKLKLTPMLGYPRFRMDYEAEIFYLGKQRFSRAHWAYPFLPRWMQIQGRLAKETFSIFNNSIWETLCEGDDKHHIRQVCEECFGPLRINDDGDYFCRDCGLLLGESMLLPGYDSILQSAPMPHHNYYDYSGAVEDAKTKTRTSGSKTKRKANYKNR